MRFESFIAWKHLTRRHKTGFISLISLISVAGVAVGVMALIVVLGVMSGFDRELKSKIVNVQPHLRIERIGGVNDAQQDIQKIVDLHLPGLQSIASFVEGQGILKSEQNATGVIVKGLDPQNEDMSIYQKHIVAGRFDLNDTTRTIIKRRFFFFKKRVQVPQGSILIGENLAAALHVRTGDVINLISPLQEKMRSIIPALPTQAVSYPFVVRGIFRLGMNEFDSAMAVISLPRAQIVYRLGNRVTGIGVRFYHVDDAQRWKPLVVGQYNANYVVRSWYDLNENFFQALKVEKSVMTILLALIVLVAAFNIVSTLIMVVMEKTKDIGILRALGATRSSIGKIFVFEGLSVGIFGVVLGAVAGLLLAFNLNAVSDFLKSTTGLEVFPSDIYYFDRIPVEVHPPDVTLIIVFAVIASVVAGFYPAYRAAKLNPVEALRYE